MAPISKLIPFLFLTTLFFSLQLNARESQFFSKVTPLTNNLKQTELENNEGSLNKPEQQQQQQPVFMPETENSYGLYGHETGLHPPNTTPTTFKPYKTTTTEEENANNFHSFKKDAYNTNQNELSETTPTATSFNTYFYSGKDAFQKQNQLSDTKFAEGGYTSMENQNNNNNNYFYNSKDAEGNQNSNDNAANDRYYNSNNNHNAANERYYNNNDNAANERYYYNNNNNDAANNRYYKTKAVNNGERQGLSDTRFMEGGKYFYDVNSEKYNNPTQYGGSSRGVNSEQWYNNRGYFGNNNVNSYENKNSMEGYQNQEQFEDDQEEFEPWASVISVTVKSWFFFWFGVFTVGVDDDRCFTVLYIINYKKC